MIYQTIINDQDIATQAAGKIKYYEFPDSMTMDEGPYIIIEPLDVPIPIIFGDNKRLIHDSLFQVETWSKTRIVTREIAERIESLLWDAGFRQVGGIDEFDSDVFRDARRYRKSVYSDAFILKEFETHDELRSFAAIKTIFSGLLKKELGLRALVNEKTSVFLVENMEKVFSFSFFSQTNTTTTGKIGSYGLFSGETISDSFINASLKRDRIASFFIESQSKTNGNLKRIQPFAAEILVNTFNAATMEIRSFNDLTVGIAANTINAATMDVESAKPMIEATNLFNAVRLDWQPTINTTSYTVYRSDVFGDLGTIVPGGESIVSNTYTDETAIGGNTYYYTVQAGNINRAINSDQVVASPSSIQIYENRLVDFEGVAAYTVYDETLATNDFGNVATLQGGTRLKYDTSGRLRFELPQGFVGSADTGGIIKASIVGKNEYNFEYGVRFDNLFPWSKGGKLPGFSGGVDYTGGDPAWAGDGFSVRLMWREEGKIIPYVYHKNQPGIYGDDFDATLGYFDTNFHVIKYFARLNTGENADGILRIYMDDVLLFEKTDLVYRTDESKIDTAHISIFAGGSTADWNMTASSYIRLYDYKWY